MSAWIRKILRLPGVKLAPETVLASTLEKSPHIKAVAIAIIWNDDTMDFDWSQMTVAQFVLLAKMLEHEALLEARGRCNDK